MDDWYPCVGKQVEAQQVQTPPEFDRLLNKVRERVEGAFDILKEGDVP